MVLPLDKTFLKEKDGKKFYNIIVEEEQLVWIEAQLAEHNRIREEFKNDLVEAMKDAKDILDGKKEGLTFEEILANLD
jgi:hypothetical protein